MLRQGVTNPYLRRQWLLVNNRKCSGVSSRTFRSNSLQQLHTSSNFVVCMAGCSWLAGTYSTARCDFSSMFAIPSFYAESRREESRTLIMKQRIQEQQQQLTLKKNWKETLRRGVRMVYRFVKLMVTLAPVAAVYPFVVLFRKREKEEDAQDIVLWKGNDEPPGGLVGWYFQLCLHCVEISGAAVIKLMQWAGSRPDLFGHDFCNVFSQLQDSTTPHRWKHTERMLAEAYGPNWRDNICIEEILGSGCIGQVYKGRVKNKQKDGSVVEQDVAVKIMHPNVEEDIDADLDLMRWAVRAVSYLPFDYFANMKWLDPEGIVEEFAYLLKLQLDLRNEAENLSRFNEHFKDEENVLFPKLVEGYEPSKDVLIETFCEGKPVLQYAKEHRDDKERLTELCMTGINTVCKMIFLDNFMHGDLHPGNVFISEDNKLILFDVGIVTEYTEADHTTIVDILAAFIRHQGTRAGRLMIDQSNRRMKDQEDAAIDEEKFMQKIEILTTKAKQKDYLMEHLGTYITYLCDAAAQHHVMLNPSFITAALAVKVQEGMVLALDPSVEIWRVAIPVIVESERRRGAMRRRITEVFGIDNILRSLRGEVAAETTCSEN